MKKHSSLRSGILVLFLGVTGMSAQSCASTNSFATASSHAVNASGEVLASGAASVAGSVQTAASVVAVPLWMSGTVLSSAGAVSTAVGQGADKAGAAVMKSGDKLWDFGSGDPAQRPALDHTHAVVPPLTSRAPAAKDPAPADVMKRM